jgi:hypothetical protein
MPAGHKIPALLLALLCLCLLAGTELSQYYSTTPSSSIAPVPAGFDAAVPLTLLNVEHAGAKTHQHPYGTTVCVEFSSELGHFGPFELQLDSSHLHPSATLEVHSDSGLVDTLAYTYQTFTSSPEASGTGDWLTVRCVCVRVRVYV